MGPERETKDIVALENGLPVSLTPTDRTATKATDANNTARQLNKCDGVGGISHKWWACALIGVFVIFMLIVPVYWAVSSAYPDGLDKLSEQQGVPEKEPMYSPPVAELQEYGRDIPAYVFSGMIGAIAVLAILLLVSRILLQQRLTPNIQAK